MRHARIKLRRGTDAPEVARACGPAPVDEDAPGAALDPPPSVGRIHAGWQSNLTSREPSLAADAGRLCGLDASAATVAGALHLHEGIERQDAYLLIGSGNVLVAAVADGVSSKPSSGEGARLACAATGDVLAALGGAKLNEMLDHREVPLLVRELTAVEHRIRSHALGRFGVDRDEELATTLIVAVMRAEGTEAIALVVSIGDSSALLLDGEGLHPLLKDESTGGAGLTRFLPRPGAVEAAVGTSLRLGPGTAIALVSDGVADDVAMSSDVREWLAPRWRSARTPLDAAHALTYRRQGSFDDRTAVVIGPSA